MGERGAELLRCLCSGAKIHEDHRGSRFKRKKKKRKEERNGKEKAEPKPSKSQNTYRSFSILSCVNLW